MNGTNRVRLLLAFAVVYLVWGSTFFGVALALKSFPPFLLSSIRFLLAGLALLCYCLYRRESLPSRADLMKHMLCGCLIFLGGIVAVVWAQQFISSSLASVIITTPFWFILLDKREWNYYFSNKWIVGGLLLGLLGTVLLMRLKNGRVGTGTADMQILAISIIILGSLLWVAVSLFLKYKSSKSSVFVNSCIQFLSAGLFCLPLSFLSHEWSRFNIQSVETSALCALFYLSFASSLLGFLSYIWLIKVQPPAIVSTYAYVNPMVATLLGWAFLGEKIVPMQIVGLLVILLGVALVNVPRYQALRRRG